MVDIEQLPINQVLRYTNDDYLNGNNNFEGVISNGLILDLTELTSDKEIYSFSVFLNDYVNEELIFEDSDIFMNIKHVDQIEVDEEYIVYFDFNTKELIMRYYIVGVKEFNKYQYLLTRIRCPYAGGWNANPRIKYNILAVEFYSFSGKTLGNVTQNIYNTTMDFKARVDSYALVYINDEGSIFENFNVNFNKMSFSIMGNPLVDEEPLIYNKEFTEEIVTGNINHEVDNVEYPWTVYFLWSYDLEDLSRVVRILLVNNMFEYNQGYGTLLGIMDYPSEIDIDNCVCEFKMFTKYGVEIFKISDIDQNDGENFVWEELIVNDGGEDNQIGYYCNINIPSNIIYKYTGEP